MEITGVQRLRKYVASLSLVTLITSMFVANVAHGAAFTDVQSGDWFYTYVEQLASGGLLDTKQKKYRPGDNANRAEAAKMLVDAAGLTLDASAGPSFKDVAKDAWYYKYVETAVKNGIVGGYKDAAGKATGKFGPGDNVTREQFAKMAYLALALKKNTDGGPHFSDVPADRWSYENVETLYNWSVIDGYADKTFGPAKNINRAEISKMVVGAMNPVKRPGAFKVSSAVSKSLTSVEVTFSDDVDATEGAKAANYSVKESGGTATLAVSAAVVKDKMVTLTTAAQMEGKKYTATVSGVKSKAGKALDSAGASADFTVAVMTFSVKSAAAKSATLAEVMFSMDVDATEAVKAANYAVKDAAGTALAVSAAALATGKTDTVWLTTAAQTVDKEYTLTVSGLKSKDAKVLAAAGSTAKFMGYNPVMAAAKSATTLEVTFSDDVDAVTGAVVANYVITPALAVSAAVVKDKMVTLTTASQTGNTAYVLAVKGVKSKVVAPAVAKDLDGSAKFTGFSTTPVVASGQLTVASASETPAAKTIATKTANNTLLVLDLTASSGEVQVSGVKVWKTGLYNDSSVKVVAFNAAGDRISSGVTFSDGMAALGFYSPLKVSGSAATKVWLNVSITGTANGNLGLRVKEAVDVTSNSSKVSGSFPIDSVVNTVVDGTPSVAAVAIDQSTITDTTTAASVDIGVTNYELAKFKFSETSSKEDVKIRTLTVFNNGSVADGDVKNFTLVDQSGNALAKVVDQKGKLVKFDITKSPYVLPKGAVRIFSVKVDVVNGATRTAQLLIQNDFDVDMLGSATGASILPSAGTDDASFPIGDKTTTYNAISINEGSLTVSKSNLSPSGDVTIGATDTVLGAFELKAAGEDIELQRLKIDLSSNGVGTTNQGTATTGAMECISTAACDLTGSVKVMVDTNLDGIGDTTLLSTSAAPATLADLWTQASLANLDLSSFYTIPGGKTVNLLIVGSITSNVANTLTGETIRVGLRDVYHYKKASLKYGTVAATLVQANTITVNQSTLTVSNNTAYGPQTMVAQSSVKIGSFVVKASSAEAVNVTSINLRGALTCGAAATSTVSGYSNVTLKSTDSAGASIQLGTTKSTVTFNGASGGTDNSFSISGFTVDAGGQRAIDVYADIASGATNLCLDIPLTGISGTGKVSVTTVNGPAAALDLQLITVVSSGTLTVAVSNATPIAQQFTAGSVGNQVLLLEARASNAEDLYIKKLRFNVNAQGQDVALLQAMLKVGTSQTALTQVGSTLNWLPGTAAAPATPGAVEWTFSGTSRPKVTKNGTLFLGLYIDFANSNTQVVSGKTPNFVLSDLQAEGVATLTASRSASPTSPLTTLSVETGVVPQAGGTAAANQTFVDSTRTMTASAAIAATDTFLPATTTGTALVPGDIIFVDIGTGTGITANNDAWDPSVEELMVVLSDSAASANQLRVQRAAFGTSALAYTNTGTAGNNNIYVLNTVAAASGLVGNTMNLYNTKPIFAVNTALNPSGTGQTAGVDKTVFVFNVIADNNVADPGLNKARLTSIDVTTSKAGTNVSNVKLVPYILGTERLDLATTCVALSQTKWRCTLLTTASGSHEVMEGQTNTYSVHADTVAAATSSLDVYIAALGSAGTVGDVAWIDVASFGTGTGATDTASTWVYQTGATQVKGASGLSYTAASGGTVDATAPIISNLVAANTVAAAGPATGFTAGPGVFDATGDSYVITFSEAIDPTTIVASGLIPGGTAVSVASATGALTGTISATSTTTATSAVTTVTIRNIATFTATYTGTSGAVVGATLAGSTVNLTLNSTGTQLTVAPTALTTAVGPTSSAGGLVNPANIAAGLQSTTTVRDINGVASVNGTAATAQSGLF